MTWTLLLTVLALFTAKATSQGEEVAPPPPVPSAALTCSSALDVQFVLDSSSTIGAENFKLILTFTSAVVKGLDIGEDLTRVSLNRYTSWVDHRFFFNDIYDKEAMMTEIDACPYYGRGTETARALQETARHSLQPYSGWRGNEVATVAVVITDGRTDDAALIPLHARALKAKATRVIAIGVGPEIVESELIEIATIPDSDVIMLSSYEDLNSRVAEVLEKICAAAEAENECLVDNGGCAEICVNTIPAFYCLCAPGYTASGTDCVDVNECLDNNGGCSDTCTNEDGGYSCSCPAGSALSADEHTCVADSCYGNDECHHTCNNIVNGAFYCTCDGGYALAEDRRTCVDIDECELNPCENQCNNTVGGFECGCPDGYGLRADGRTCGNLCYSCEHVTDNAECATEVVCQPGATACQTETRIEEGQVFITKRCKQPEACENNFIQNPKTAFNPTQCNNEPDTDISVCRCCCHQSLCNPDAACDPETTSDLTCPPESLFDLPAGTDISCTGNAVGDICSIVCPEGYAPANGVDELICNLKPRSTDGEWVGEISPCVDVDECATLNGGCSHFCSNTNGSYECSCPDDNSCQLQVFDIFFILDSSSSVKQSNFDIMLDFVAAVTDGFTVGQDAVRVGVMTYNKKQFPQINLGDCESNEALTEKLRDIPYKGRGTLTAAAISFTADSLLGEAQGRRAGVPLVVAIITDGRSKDSANLEQAIGRLLTHTDAIFAIGVTKRVNEQELLTIVSGDKTRYRIVDDFSNLNDDLLADFSFCVQPESGLALAPDGKTCDADECADGNGGCSDECINTIGSYICLCPEGQSLVNDGMTCDEDECLVDNGGCQGGCVNTYGGYNCLCSNEFDVLDTDCVDYDECQDDNGGCSDGCNNLPGTFECTCPPGFAIDTDGLNCVEDSCYEPTFPFICDHNCVNVPNGAYFCTCMEGYTLADDGHNCTEIDECAVNNGGCDHLCVNLDGSYECQCNDGFLLRDDGKTCGIACYECINAATNEDCNNTVACPVSADACFTTMRTRNNVTRITKGCQQTLACINNLIQNPRHAGEGPSQCNGNDINSKCECCCFSSYCNVELCPYASDLPTCPGVDAPDVEPRGLVEETGEVMPGGIALLVCPAGFAPSQGGAGLEQLNCVYNFENQTSEWDGNQADIDVCVDINECEINNGGCVAPAECVNFDGGFECVCPDEPTDYVLVDGVICERDECADPDQGGCSHNCTNTIGSFVCFCPPELSLVEDGLTCNFDECREGNGGCMEVCVNTLEGNECACRTEGYEIAADGLSCQDIDECLIDNGGCDDVCTNLVPGYECSCNAGRLLADDGFSCKDDPCYLDNGGCEQICTVIDDGFICECSPGFLLNEDGSCVDINECESGAADCQYNCTNFEGGYECICPTGMALHVDGKTCGRACYSCQGAATNEECNAQPLEVCTDDAQSCENEVRVHHGVKAIFKRCKQTLSCDNNYIQNPRDAAVPSQCNGGTENDVCRCCCEGHLCNVNERPCAAKQCVMSPADIAVVLDSSSSVKYDNFQTMKAFVKDLLSAFKLGEGEVETALVRYNKKSTVEFNFDSDNTKGGVMDAIGSIPYRGSGTRTGAAIEMATTLYAGRTAPRIMIVITDGRSQDDVAAPAAAARAAGITTLAVGIGNIDEDEIIAIAGDENLAFVTEDFAQLSGIPEMIQGSLCADEDECAVDNGGCSDLCVNTDGSFKCECSEGFVLSGDLFTCVEATDGARDAVNECAENNGGCSDICIDQLEGYNCSCHPGSELDMGGKLCVDIDECAALPCVDGKCINMKGMHYCECAESKVLLDDDATCVDRAAEADCAEGYLALGYGCLRQNTAIINYQSAEEACALDGGRLVKVDDAGMARIVGRKFAGENWIGLDDRSEDGVWVHSDGSLNTFNNWDAGFPGDGDCAYLDGVFKNENCRFRRASVCEIPRAEPVLVFTSSWPNGAQAKLYMASGYAKVTFPADVLEVNAWFCKMVARDGNTIFFSQDANEKQAGDGRCEFVVQAAARFPSGGCSAANSSEDELLAMAE